MPAGNRWARFPAAHCGGALRIAPVAETPRPAPKAQDDLTKLCRTELLIRRSPSAAVNIGASGGEAGAERQGRSTARNVLRRSGDMLYTL